MLQRGARRFLGGLLLTTALAVLYGCPAPQPPPQPGPGGPGSGSGKACTSAADCATGEDCQGSDTCGSAWTCGPTRPCTLDLVEYCACDGTVFQGSSTCPTKPYQHRGRC
jgi:hypothetical protein